MRMIDADELKNQIRHMPRTINQDLVQYSLVKAIIENMPTLISPNEWVSVEKRLPEDDAPAGRKQITVMVTTKAGKVTI